MALLYSMILHTRTHVSAVTRTRSHTRIHITGPIPIRARELCKQSSMWLALFSSTFCPISGPASVTSLGPPYSPAANKTTTKCDIRLTNHTVYHADLDVCVTTAYQKSQTLSDIVSSHFKARCERFNRGRFCRKRNKDQTQQPVSVSETGRTRGDVRREQNGLLSTAPYPTMEEFLTEETESGACIILNVI